MASALLEKLSKVLSDQNADEPAELARPANPKIAQIVSILEANPLLVEPTRRFVLQKVGEANGAILGVLYSPAELEELKKKL